MKRAVRVHETGSVNALGRRARKEPGVAWKISTTAPTVNTDTSAKYSTPCLQIKTNKLLLDVFLSPPERRISSAHRTEVRRAERDSKMTIRMARRVSTISILDPPVHLTPGAEMISRMTQVSPSVPSVKRIYRLLPYTAHVRAVNVITTAALPSTLVAANILYQ